MLAVSEALLVDQARADDHTRILRGHPPAAEQMLRAVLAGQPVPESGDAAEAAGFVEEEDDMDVASITDLAEWVAEANRLMGGRR